MANQTPDQPEKRKSEPQVLIVDDQVADLYLLYSVFEFLQCKVTRAVDGHSAIAFLKEREYDLVIMDWLMPGKGANEVIQIIERRARGQKTEHPLPLVIYTGLAAKDLRLPTLSYFSLVDVWEKSLNLTQLIRQADGLIRRMRK